MFSDAVNVREELEDALSEFMLMGDKAKLTLEEELARMESSMNEPEEGLDEVEALREQLHAARKIVDVIKVEKEQTEERLEQVLDDAEQLRLEADQARRERESLEQDFASAAGGAKGGAESALTRQLQQSQEESRYLRAQLQQAQSQGEGSSAGVKASSDHPGDLFVEQVLYPRFNDLSSSVKAIQEYLFHEKGGDGRRRRGSTGSIQAVREFVSKRVKRVKGQKSSGDGELGRVMDDAEDMRIDLENALNEFLGHGSIEGMQVISSPP